VRDLARLEQLTEIPNLLSLIAHRSGNLLNLAELSRSVGLTQTTLKRYFGLLETLFLVTRLPAWERNSAKRLVKSPKVFIPDSGLLAFLRAPGAQPDEAPSWLGGWVETFVLAELRKHLAFSERELRLWHYRTQAGMEVDFLLEAPNGMLTAIEVKASSMVTAKDFKGLRHLKETEPNRFKRGIVLYCGREPVPFARDLIALPLSIWWAKAPS
jgi:predicted AAA+ superfamily ATPase